MLIFVTFWVLFMVTLFQPGGWQAVRQKSREAWLLDSCGLVMQGAIVPTLQLCLGQWVYPWLWPQFAHCLSCSNGLGFLLSFVVVDYAYYWNHRWLHGQGWPLHYIHHTVTDFDVLGTSRNTIWSSFFILYLWVHSVMIYLLQPSAGYMLGVSLTAILDLWRHSCCLLPENHWLMHILGIFLVLPQDHAQHHARSDCNYSANFRLWDHWHGTATSQRQFPEKMGDRPLLPLWRQLLYPSLRE
jgi:sterol desaturase/sphingolipid hydroxylase (fatty acid hydroxylase superfamily)